MKLPQQRGIFMVPIVIDSGSDAKITAPMNPWNKLWVRRIMLKKVPLMYRFVFALLLISSLGRAASGQRHDDELVITLERTTCLGTCPAYKLTIREDGTVVYEGKKFVRITGTKQSNIDKAMVAGLLKAFVDADYFELRDSYDTIHNPDGTETVVTDLPTTYTSLTLNGRSKKIEDYVGAPKQLEELEGKIDEVAGSKRWVSIDAVAVHEEAIHGWDVNSRDAQKLLMEAAERGDAEVVRAFINAGANVNARLGAVMPLQQARGSETVKILISAGADVNASSKEYFGPPLVFAAKRGDVESITVLLQAGAKVNGRSPDGETPLIEAARSGNPAAVGALLQAGADINAKDNYGDDALKYAALGLAHQESLAKNPEPFEDVLPAYSNKYREIREMLIAAGGKDKPLAK
jgi:hypothetical protein